VRGAITQARRGPPDFERLSARELRKFLAGKGRRLRAIYRSAVVLVIAVVIGLCGHVIFYYNYLTALDSDVRTAKSKIAAALQYRKNLIPVLIESVATFVHHEGRVFQHTVDARERELTSSERISSELNRAARPTTGDKKGADSSVRDLFQRIMAIAEQYPLLKTSEAFQLLMKQVSDAESKIMMERARYNDAVNAYCSAIAMFPGNVYRSVFGFKPHPLFEDKAGAEWQPLKLAAQSQPAQGVQ
jgi:LemA protein